MRRHKIIDVPTGVGILNSGGIIIFPTDTAYGIGCRMDKPEAIERLFRVRQRPRTQATPVLVSSAAMAFDYISGPTVQAVSLMATCWPGALTIVMACKTDRIPEPVRGGSATVGWRMPDHDLTLSLIRKTGVPILGPSANIHGRNTPHRLEELDSELTDTVDGILPGDCPTGSVSTVIDATGESLSVIRQGAAAADLPEKRMDFPCLWIDTSGQDLSAVSVIRTNGIRTFRSERSSVSSENLLPLIDRALRSSRIGIMDIRSVGISVGPGSFTGLRVGAAAAKAIGLLTGVPVNCRSAQTDVPLRYTGSRF